MEDADRLAQPPTQSPLADAKSYDPFRDPEATSAPSNDTLLLGGRADAQASQQAGDRADDLPPGYCPAEHLRVELALGALEMDLAATVRGPGPLTHH